MHWHSGYTCNYYAQWILYNSMQILGSYKTHDSCGMVAHQKSIFIINTIAEAHNGKERPTLYYQLVPTYDQNPLTFLK